MLDGSEIGVVDLIFKLSLVYSSTGSITQALSIFPPSVMREHRKLVVCERSSAGILNFKNQNEGKFDLSLYLRGISEDWLGCVGVECAPISQDAVFAQERYSVCCFIHICSRSDWVYCCVCAIDQVRTCVLVSLAERGCDAVTIWISNNQETVLHYKCDRSVRKEYWVRLSS